MLIIIVIYSQSIVLLKQNKMSFLSLMKFLLRILFFPHLILKSLGSHSLTPHLPVSVSSIPLTPSL